MIIAITHPLCDAIIEEERPNKAIRILSGIKNPDQLNLCDDNEQDGLSAIIYGIVRLNYYCKKDLIQIITTINLKRSFI